MEYQENYTQNPVAQRHMYDRDERELKALKIVAVLRDYLGDLGPLSVLDMSCSTGLIAAQLAKQFGLVTGIDIDKAAVAHATREFSNARVKFDCMDALSTGFADRTFDVVICNQMYEHVPDARKLMAEIHRVLKEGGVCYFGVTNRLKIIETHYGKIPFLSWLPKPLANAYLRLLGRGTHYYENLLSYWGLSRLTRDFERVDYTVKVIRDPERFHATDSVRAGSLAQRAALAVARTAYWFMPGYIWLLRRPVSGDRCGQEVMGADCASICRPAVPN
jgi:2-polyprenyl-3-methyl-5-hydroxy-6-metoxy-1,4-benzoquinol methylase